MKRFKYGLNSQVAQAANFGELVCIGVHEVAPGDTIGGSMVTKVLTESVTKTIMTRS